VAVLDPEKPSAPGSTDGSAAELLGLLSQLASRPAPDPATAIVLLLQAAKLLGAESAVFTSFVRDDATLSSYRSLLACDPEWGTQYAKNEWCLADPWLRYALFNTEPVASEDLPADNERERWVTEAASQYGFASALIVPAPTAAAQSRVGVLCLGSSTPRHFATEHGAVRCLARSLAMELGDWMHRKVKAELIVHARISEADLVLLRHEQAGHSSKVIAAELHVEPKTIDCRFHRLCLRLGAPNRHAAVRLAELYGLI
jgi:DNA-binding CsgD family transcriptional regulator